MANIFDSEKEMQDWLSDKFNKDIFVKDLLIDIEGFENFSPKNLAQRKVYESFEHCIPSLDMHDTLTEDKNISKNPGDVLRPDFLLFAGETNSIVIVELKNFKAASRQAGTELSAYAGEIKSYIPYISDGDIINVIISPKWPTLLKHYVFHEIFWTHRNIICLEPVEKNNNISLKIVDIPTFIDDDFSFKIGPKHLAGYNICLYEYNPTEEYDELSNFNIFSNQMIASLVGMANKGNRLRSHGFAFLWKAKSPILAPFFITLVNFSAFESLERLLHNKEFEPNEITKKLIDIVIDYGPIDHSESLEMIAETGIKFLESFSYPQIENFNTWDYLKSEMLEQGFPIAFQAWGAFEEIFLDELIEAYSEEENRVISPYNPYLGLDVIEYLIDYNYEFIQLSSVYRKNDDLDSENL